MKKLALFLVFIISSFNTVFASHVVEKKQQFKKGRKALYVVLTEGIAYRLGYYHAVRAQRNKASQFIDSLRRTLRIKVGDLLFDRRLHQVEARSREYVNFISYYEAAFDDLFEKQDELVLKRGTQLDNLNATVEEKEEFVKKAISDLKAGVDKIIDEAKRKLPRQLNI